MSDLFEALRLFITNTGPRSRLEVGGELDVATVEAFGAHLALLIEAGIGDVDMALVTFCDAATVGVLLTAHHQLGGAGRRLRVINASRPALRLLTLAAVDTLLLGPIRRIEPGGHQNAPTGEQDLTASALATNRRPRPRRRSRVEQTQPRTRPAARRRASRTCRQRTASSFGSRR